MALTFAQEDAEEQLLSKALYVDCEDLDSAQFDSSKPPATAEEYLKGVIREANALEDVGIAKNASKLTSKAVHIAVREKAQLGESDTILPTEEWQNKQVADFSRVRLQFARHAAYVQKQDIEERKRHKLPSKTNEQGWCTFCYGKEFWNDILEARKQMDDEDEENISDEKPITQHNKHSSAFNDLPNGELPLTSIITQLKQNELVYLLELQIDWAEVIGIKIKEQGLWIYALMAALEKPPHPDVTSTLRSLVLACSQQRKRISQDQSDSLNQKPIPNIVVHLNLLICLVAKYFGQKDLADGNH